MLPSPKWIPKRAFRAILAKHRSYHSSSLFKTLFWFHIFQDKSQKETFLQCPARSVPFFLFDLISHNSLPYCAPALLASLLFFEYGTPAFLLQVFCIGYFLVWNTFLQAITSSFKSAQMLSQIRPTWQLYLKLQLAFWSSFCILIFFIFFSSNSYLLIDYVIFLLTMFVV